MISKEVVKFRSWKTWKSHRQGLEKSWNFKDVHVHCMKPVSLRNDVIKGGDSLTTDPEQLLLKDCSLKTILW